MSSPNVDRFIDFLVMECEDTSTTDYVDGLLTAAKAEIQAGNGSIGFLQTSGGNGKSVGQGEHLTCAEMAFACRKALRIYADAGGQSPIVFPDFGGTFQ